MGRDGGYQFLDGGQRMKTYQDLLIKELREYQERTLRRTWELFESRREEMEGSFCKAMAEANDWLSSCISSGTKEKISFIHISYLLSGALSGEMLLKLDFYDKRYYSDPEEADFFWDCHELFPEHDDELNRMVREIRERVIRAKSNEISMAGICMTACNCLVLKPIVEKLVQCRSFERLTEAYRDDRVPVLYGAYLDEAEVIHEMKGGGVT